MKIESIKRAGSLVNVLIVAMIVWQFHLGSDLLPGALYLAAAGFPSLFVLELCAKLRSNKGEARLRKFGTSIQELAYFSFPDGR
jgi:hypothetical protein